MQNGNPTLPHVIDATMMAAFKACPQKFFLEFVCGYRPKGLSIDLHAGACFASAVEEVRRRVHFLHEPLPEALLKAQAKFFIEWGDVEPPDRPTKRPKNKDNVWFGVESYFERWSPLTDYVKPYHTTEGQPTVEYTFSIPLDDDNFPRHPSDGAPFIYAGKFDMLGELYGRPVPLDDKTTSGIGPTWADQWNLRSQFLGYLWALQQLGLDCDTVVVRGVSFQMEQIKLIEAIRPYTNFLIERWHHQLHRDLERMIRCYEYGYWDFDLAESCTAYGGCMFRGVCESPHSESWLTEFDIRPWNPLDHHPDRAATTNPPLVR